MVNVYQLFFLLLGSFGGFVTWLGFFLGNRPLFYFVGSMALLITAIYYRILYFIALELILISGHALLLPHVPLLLQAALPLLLCLQLFVFYFLVEKDSGRSLFSGILGIAILSVGFVFHHQAIFFIGSFLIASYSFSLQRQYSIAIIWGVTNSMFAILALIKLFKEIA